MSKIEISSGSAKDRENQELQEMLQMDHDKISSGLLGVIEHGDPSKWRNTPVAVSQSIKILSKQQQQSVDNFRHILQFLTRLTKSVLTKLSQSEQEMQVMKNKFTRDLSSLERNVDDKIKRNKKEIDENLGLQEEKVNALLE